ncbi:hypothetical protein GCM10010212_13730 [Paenarthrobacter nicotinovorans]|nr:hypothetical protein GCM10010212_13730 [Paenarthrobacter nicotinovorans]
MKVQAIPGPVHPAVAEDSYSVGDLQHLVQQVRHVDNGESLRRGQPAHEPDQGRYFMRAEGCRWFIQNEKVRFPSQRPSDFNDLLLPH